MGETRTPELDIEGLSEEDELAARRDLRQLLSFLDNAGYSYDAPVKIFLTTQYEKAIEQFVAANGLAESYYAAPGEASYAKPFTSDGSHSIFVRILGTEVGHLYFYDIIAEQLIWCSKQCNGLRSRWSILSDMHLNPGLDSDMKRSFFQWHKTAVVRSTIEKLYEQLRQTLKVPVQSLPASRSSESYDITLNNFRSAVRKRHYDNASQPDASRLYGVILEINIVISRYIERSCSGQSLECFAEFDEPLRQIVDFVFNKMDRSEDVVQIRTSEIFELIRPLFTLCCIREIKLLDTPFRFVPTRDPRVVFKDRVVDTSPGIVSFVDILGFTKHVQSRHTDRTSDVLREIKNTLDGAMTNTFAIYDSFAVNSYPQIAADIRNSIVSSIGEVFSNVPALQPYKTLLDQYFEEIPFLDHPEEFLEYRFFSDCLAISTLYVEGELFLAELLKVLVLSANYQLLLMTGGFYVRGAMAIGSIYSNAHMIFSDALVKAYKLEQTKAQYPRIILDSELLEHVAELAADPERRNGLLSQPYWHKLLIRECNTGIIFVNPYFSHLYTSSNGAKKEVYDKMDQIKEHMDRTLQTCEHGSRVYEKHVWLQGLYHWVFATDAEAGMFEYILPSEIDRGASG